MNFSKIKEMWGCICNLKGRVEALEEGGGGGGAGINFLGEWTSLGDEYPYSAGDAVLYDVPGDGFGANLYQAINDHVSSIGSPPDGDANWVLIVGGGGDGAAGASADSSINAFIESPTAKTYVMALYMNRAGTIASLVAKTASGTVTCNVRINGVSVTGLSAVAVTSVESTTNSSGANTFAIGDTIEVVCSSVSSAADLQLSVLI